MDETSTWRLRLLLKKKQCVEEIPADYFPVAGNGLMVVADGIHQLRMGVSSRPRIDIQKGTSAAEEVSPWLAHFCAT